MKNIRRHIMRSRVNSVWYCIRRRGKEPAETEKIVINKKITLEKNKKESKNET